MIKIGVNEPVFIEKAEKNDKGTLSITITEAEAATKIKGSLLDQMNEGSDASGSNAGSTTFLLFAPSREYQNEQLSPEKQVANLMGFKNQLSHLLKRYTMEKNIKWNVFAGVVIKTEEDLLAKIQEEATFLKIYANIVDQFLEQAKKFNIFDKTKLSRLLLIRQSKEKAFGRFRDKYLESRPFFEDIAIPKANSKMYVKAGTPGATTYFEPVDGFVPNFDAYEITQGKDNPIISSSKPDSAANTADEAEKVEGVFGQKTEEPINFGAAEDTDGGVNFGQPEEADEVPGLNETKEE